MCSAQMACLRQRSSRLVVKLVVTRRVPSTMSACFTQAALTRTRRAIDRVELLVARHGRWSAGSADTGWDCSSVDKSPSATGGTIYARPLADGSLFTLMVLVCSSALISDDACVALGTATVTLFARYYLGIWRVPKRPGVLAESGYWRQVVAPAQQTRDVSSSLDADRSAYALRAPAGPCPSGLRSWQR